MEIIWGTEEGGGWREAHQQDREGGESVEKEDQSAFRQNGRVNIRETGIEEQEPNSSNNSRRPTSRK